MVPNPPLVERRSYGEHASQFLDLYQPSAASSNGRGTVVSVHGGYWRQKYGLELNEPIATHLVTNGWTVANIEYRRVEPDGPGVWHEMSSDVLDAVALLDDHDEPMIALGHSAGGQLALWAAAQPSTPLDAVVALAPVSDLFLADGLELSNHATAALFDHTASERPDLYATASPLHLLPLGIPQLLVHGRADEDVPFEMVPEYIETAHLSGDDVTLLDPKNVDHYQIIDPSHDVWRKIDSWLEGVVS